MYGFFYAWELKDSFTCNYNIITFNYCIAMRGNGITKHHNDEVKRRQRKPNQSRFQKHADYKYGAADSFQLEPKSAAEQAAIKERLAKLKRRENIWMTVLLSGFILFLATIIILLTIN